MAIHIYNLPEVPQPPGGYVLESESTHGIQLQDPVTWYLKVLKKPVGIW